MPVNSYSNQRERNILELRQTYNALLEEYYTLYQQYLGYKFSSNRDPRTVTRQRAVPIYTVQGDGETPDPSYKNLDKINTGCNPVCSTDDLKQVAQKCSDNTSCKGYTNYGELKGIGADDLVTFDIPIGGTKVSFFKKDTEEQVTIPPAQLATNARGRLNELKAKIDAILAELKTNIDTTDMKLRNHGEEVDNKRQVILSRNKKIQEQDADLETINLKLTSRKRQNEFSAERNRYKKVLLVILVVCNIILLGYFGHLITGGTSVSL